MADPTIIVRSLDTVEARADAIATMLAAMGWRVEMVGDREFMIPTDEAHPDYAKCVRRLERAKRKLLSRPFQKARP